jgi:hypothetical protein
MGAKHTPGPWCVAGTDQNLQPIVSTVKGDLELVTCWHHCIGSMETQAHANARLIASAPDLLEACQTALAYCEHLQSSMFGVEPTHAAELRAAIRKATGEAS